MKKINLVNMLKVIRDALLLSLVMAMASMSWLGSAAMADESGPTAGELTSELRATQRQISLILGDVLQHGPFDVSDVLDVEGSDPEVLARWVRDQTTYVPYQGLVRGEFGVLQDRLGNHLDRAMLLGRLIEESGRAVRLEITSQREPSSAVPSLEERPRPNPVTLSSGTRELLELLGARSEESQPALPDFREWNRFDQDLQARAVSLMERLAEDADFPAWQGQRDQRELTGDPKVRVWWRTTRSAGCPPT